MSKLKGFMGGQLFKATFSLLLTTGLTSIVGFIFWRIVTGYYPESSQVGEATTLMALIGASSLLAVSGINPAIVLALSSKKDEIEYKRTIHGHSLIAALIASVITVTVQTVLLFTSNFEFLKNPYVFALGVVTSALAAGGSTVDSTSVALHKSGMVPFRNTGQSIIKTALIVPLIILLNDASYAAVINATLTAFVGGWIMTLIVLKRTSGRFFFRLSDVKYSWGVIKGSLGHHQITSLGANLPPVLTPLIVTGLIGTSESAIFSIVWMIGALFFTVSPSVSSAVLASTANRDDVHLKHRIKQASWIILGLMSVPMALVFLFPDYILKFFGDDYEKGAFLIILLALSALPDAITNIAVAYLRLKKDLKPASILNVLMGLSTIGLIFVLVPFAGINAPGWAWLATQTTGAIGILAYIWFRYILVNKKAK